MAISFDCFGTLVTADRPAEPWSVVADELAARDVEIPEDWESAYRSSHVDLQPLEELSLVTHTAAALESHGINPPRAVVREALLDAFDSPISVCDGAGVALQVVAAAGPVGICSNCSVPGLVERTLDRADFSISFDAVVTSVGCGWRKPHDRAFNSIATALDVSPADLLHVGDDPRTDGGARTGGVTVVLTDEVPLRSFPDWVEGTAWT